MFQLVVMIAGLFVGLISMMLNENVRNLNQIFMQVILVILMSWMIYDVRKSTNKRAMKLSIFLVSLFSLLFSFSIYIFAQGFQLNYGALIILCAIIAGVGFTALLLEVLYKDKS